ARLQAELAKTVREPFDRLRLAGCSGCAAFELVGSELLDRLRQALRIDRTGMIRRERGRAEYRDQGQEGMSWCECHVRARVTGAAGVCNSGACGARAPCASSRP